jgi:hypothetical protein
MGCHDSLGNADCPHDGQRAAAGGGAPALVRDVGLKSGLGATSRARANSELHVRCSVRAAAFFGWHGAAADLKAHGEKGEFRASPRETLSHASSISAQGSLQKLKIPWRRP